ncbi:MAG: hypothetical protein ACI83P_002518, partial [Janthinobacterium sp.]
CAWQHDDMVDLAGTDFERKAGTGAADVGEQARRIVGRWLYKKRLGGHGEETETKTKTESELNGLIDLIAITFVTSVLIIAVFCLILKYLCNSNQGAT